MDTLLLLWIKSGRGNWLDRSFMRWQDGVLDDGQVIPTKDYPLNHKKTGRSRFFCGREEWL
jgi:hypothetical protein